MPDTAFWSIVILYAVISYFHTHQASHLVAIGAGDATLNPALLGLLTGAYKFVYRWLFYLPWAFLAWYGYKTVWWYAVGAFVIGWIFQLVLIKIETVSGLTRNAWAISLLGILIVPIVLLAMAQIVASIHN